MKEWDKIKELGFPADMETFKADLEKSYQAGQSDIIEELKNCSNCSHDSVYNTDNSYCKDCKAHNKWHNKSEMNKDKN